MKEKLLHIFRFVFSIPILVFISVLNLPFISSASEFTLATESLSLLEESASMLSYSSCIPYGFIPLLFLNSEKQADTEAVFCSYLGNQDLYKFDGLQVTNRPLSYDEKDSLTNNFYDASGNVVDYSNVFFCTVDNGAFSYDLYTDFDGRPLYLDVNKETPCVNVKLGGSSVSASDWDTALTSLGNYLESNQYNIALSGAEPTSNAYYLYWGWARGSDRKTAYVYCSNINCPGVCVASLGNGRAPNNIYYNDPSVVQWSNVLTSGSPNLINYSTGSYDVNGYTYHYRLQMPYVVTSSSSTSISDFENWRGGETVFNLSATSFTYDDIIANSSAVSFSKVIADDTVAFGNKYSYMDLYDYVDSISDTPVVVNPYFVPGQVISDINYPIDWVLPDFAVSGTIPFPEVIERDPAIDFPFDVPISIPSGNFEIPIISDLRYRFPFSIPWDLNNLIRGLSVAREAPRFTASWYIEPINYTWVIDIDLSAFDVQAGIFRTCFLILFLIGLAKFSYEHFFGS